MRQRNLAVAMALVIVPILAACATASPSPSVDVHAGHDQQTLRVMDALEQQLQVAFESAGPHHTLGKAPDGTEIDLIGVPVEEVILSVPSDDSTSGQRMLPYVRDLLHGPDRVYDWAAAMLACRTDANRDCEDRFEQGNLLAHFSDGGPDYVVVSFSREP